MRLILILVTDDEFVVYRRLCFVNVVFVNVDILAEMVRESGRVYRPTKNRLIIKCTYYLARVTLSNTRKHCMFNIY